MNKNKITTTEKKPMTGKVKKGFRFYCSMVAAVAMVCCFTVPAFAAGDQIMLSTTCLTLSLD